MAKKVKDPGFGYQSKKNARIVISKDGASNVKHINRLRNLSDLYTYFIDISGLHFFGLILLAYICINIIFGALYWAIGIEQITPSQGSLFQDFMSGFFFSAQTLTTVGYGGIAPHGMLANIIASFEAMIGLLGFSFITGLLYGRFSKPRANVSFSDNLILRDFKEGKALMFRLMNRRKNIMIQPEVKVTLSISEKDDSGNYKRNFYRLELERDQIMYLPTVWTVVHEITQDSPLFGYSEKQMRTLDAELYILMTYHEESYSQNVHQIHTYSFTDLELNVKYVNAYSFDSEGFTLLDHEALSKVEELNV